MKKKSLLLIIISIYIIVPSIILINNKLYKKDYNLFGISLTHIILGILTISLGIIN